MHDDAAAADHVPATQPVHANAEEVDDAADQVPARQLEQEMRVFAVAGVKMMDPGGHNGI